MNNDAELIANLNICLKSLNAFSGSLLSKVESIKPHMTPDLSADFDAQLKKVNADIQKATDLSKAIKL